MLSCRIFETTGKLCTPSHIRYRDEPLIAFSGKGENKKGVQISASRRTSVSDTRLRRWLRNKHKLRHREGGTYPLSHLYGYFGLVRLSRLGHDVAWVNA